MVIDDFTSLGTAVGVLFAIIFSFLFFSGLGVGFFARRQYGDFKKTQIFAGIIIFLLWFFIVGINLFSFLRPFYNGATLKGLINLVWPLGFLSLPTLGFLIGELLCVLNAKDKKYKIECSILISLIIIVFILFILLPGSLWDFLILGLK